MEPRAESEAFLWDLLKQEGLLVEDMMRQFEKRNESGCLGLGYIEEAEG